MKVSLDEFSPSPPPGGGDGGGGLRWEIFFSIIDSKHSSKAILYDSPPLPLTFDQPNLFYEWPSLSLHIPEMSILERDAFTVLIYLVPIDKQSGNRGRILWFPCIVQYTSMLFASAAPRGAGGGGGEKPFLQSYDYNPNVCLTMLFSAKILYKDQGRSAFFTLHHLALDIKGYELHELICKQEQHALVCASEILWRDEQTKKYCKSPLLYLNRAHDIRSSNGKDRLYIWRMDAKSGGAEEFHGMKRKSERDWHKQMQEHEDMVELGLVAPFSVKRASAFPHAPAGRGGMPDHEAHSKLNHSISPILVVPGQTVVLKFFNLFDPEDPRRSCEVHVKWNDYANAPPGAFAVSATNTMRREGGAFAKSGFKRFSLNALSKRAKSKEHPPVFRSSFIVYSGFTVEIDYIRTLETISIIAIYAHVQNYHFTINKLGHYHLLNSA